MSETPKNPLREGDAQTTPTKPLPHGRAASNAQAPGTETDKAVRDANDYALTGDESSHDEVTNPNLHYGSRTLEDPELDAGAPKPENGQAPTDDPSPLDAGDRATGGNAGTDTPAAPANGDLSDSGPSISGASPVDAGPQRSRTAGGAINSTAGDRPDASEGALSSSETLGSLASADGGTGGPVGSGGGPGGGPGDGGTPPDLGPTDIVVGGGSVDENSIQGTTVAALGTVDPEPGDTFTYAITNDPSGFFQIVGDEIQVAPGANIDYEADQSHDVTVEVTDASGNTYSEVISLSVNNLWDEGPTDILFGGGTVDENAAPGTTVATLSTVDADIGDIHTYAITNDPSGFFEIIGNEVQVAPGANIDFETASSHDITVEVTDAGGNTYSEVITLTVNDLIDEAPTDIVLTGGSVDENAASGTVVAILSTVDADAGDSHTYAITNDPSNFFEIVGNEVRVRPGALINFEAAASHDITIESTDAGGNAYSEVVTINVNDINEAPTDILPNTFSVDENATAGTVLGALSATDEDIGESFTYQILNDPSGNFRVTTGKGAGNLAVAAGATLDFEVANSHDILLQVTDSAGNTHQETVTVNVNDLIDENPTDIDLSGGSVDEGAAQGTVAAILSTVDADAGDTHTYTLTNDPSGFFEIVGNEVRVAAGANIDYETDQSHDITVQTTDAAGNTYSEVVTIAVNDLIDENPTDITLSGGSVDESAAQGTVARRAQHGRCGCRRYAHLHHHQRPLGLLRDRRQRGPGRGRRQYRLRDRPVPRHHGPDDGCGRQHLFRGRHHRGQRPDRRNADRHHAQRRIR